MTEATPQEALDQAQGRVRELYEKLGLPIDLLTDRPRLTSPWKPEGGTGWMATSHEYPIPGTVTLEVDLGAVARNNIHFPLAGTDHPGSHGGISNGI
ncbi:MAG: hypothetical protein WBP26_02400 [Candidatus Saccharimonadales bacterium]